MRTNDSPKSLNDILEKKWPTCVNLQITKSGSYSYSSTSVSVCLLHILSWYDQWHWKNNLGIQSVLMHYLQSIIVSGNYKNEYKCILISNPFDKMGLQLTVGAIFLGIPVACYCALELPVYLLPQIPRYDAQSCVVAIYPKRENASLRGKVFHAISS